MRKRYYRGLGLTALLPAMVMIGDEPICDRCEKSPCRCDVPAVIATALSSAVSAIYLADSSDYLTALWEIAGTLGGDDAVSLLSEDERAAYERYCGR